MSNIDSFILTLVKFLGGSVLIISLFLLASLLAWKLYKEIVGWPVIFKALKDSKKS